MIQLELSLFGGFAASVNSEPITQFRTDKMRALLAYLALNRGRPFRRESLATLLWSEWPDDAARRNLRQTLHRLRQLLDKLAPGLGDDLLTLTRQTVQLNGTAVSLDVAHFQQHLQTCETHPHANLHQCAACLDRMQQAAALYQGDLLDGFTLKDAYPFEEWLVVQREPLQQQMLALLDQLAQALEQRGAFEQAQAYANQQVQLAPWRESAHRQLMRLYMQQDQRTAALAQYETCRQLLDQELGVEPAEETVQLWQQIKDGTWETAASPQTPLHHFPTPLTPFVGRQEEIAQILAHLANESCRLLTLLGPGGTGKTRLSVQVGQEIGAGAGRYRDGAFFIPLAAVSNEARLVTALSYQLNVQLTEQSSPRQQLITWLQAKEMLLVCDNFEQLLSGTGLLGDILAQAPGVQILVTSRQPLNLQAEWRQPVGGLDYSAGESSEAVRLFRRSARRVAPQFKMEAADVTAVLELCRLVDGLPLALEIAAAWTRLMDCSTILRETQKSLDFLASPLGDLPERHQSMRAVLNQSWQMLPLRLQTILGQLALFAGSFTLDAAQNIVPDLSLLDLAMLLDRSLLQWQPNGRYAMHEFLRQFAGQKLAEQDATTDATAARHSDYYLAFVAQRAAQLVGANSPAAIAQITQEIDNIHLAWQTAVTQAAWSTLKNGLESLANYYTLTGSIHELEALLSQALAKLKMAESAPALTGLVWEQLGIIYTHQGRYAEASDAAQQLLVLATKQQKPELEMRSRAILGQVHQLQGRYQEAQVEYETAVAYFKEMDNKSWQAHLGNLLGHLDYMLGQFDSAVARHQRALALSQEVGNVVQQARILNDMGNVYVAMGDSDSAISCFQQALTINQKLNHPYGISRNLYSLGRIYSRQQKHDEALNYLQEALALAERMGLRRAISIGLNSIGIIYKQQGQYDEAVTYYQRALQINRELGIQDEIANNLSNLGNIYVRQKQYALAEAHFKEAVQITEEINHPEGIVGHLGNMAVMYKERGDGQQALLTLERAIGLARQLQSKYFLAFLLLTKGELLLSLERPSEAESFITEGMLLAKESNSADLISWGQKLAGGAGGGLG